jgi:hypothetical protein
MKDKILNFLLLLDESKILECVLSKIVIKIAIKYLYD